MPNRNELIYLAGVFDGEGCISIKRMRELKQESYAIE